MVAEPAPNGLPLPCEPCQELLLNKHFGAILCRHVPVDENFKYTNHQFCSKGLGEIYARTIGLQEIVEAPMSYHDLTLLFHESFQCQ